METLVLSALVVLIVLVSGLIAIVWVKWRSGDTSSEVKASLREEFLSFQTTIHRELSMARTSVDSAKDVISDHAIKTISQIKEIGGTLQSLIQQQEEAQQLGQSLKDLLQAPKLRGNYGEAILEEMLDRVLPKGIWERQYSIDGSERVDCVIRFKDVVIPIDAKFPRDDYMRFIEADAQEEKSTFWDAFESAVKKQVTSIEAKYIKPEKGTSEFALMFIPSEAIYYEIITETNQLGRPSLILAYAQDHHVMPVSPLTFYAFLQMVVLGIRNIEVIKSARKLQEGLSDLQRSFDLCYKKYEEMGKRVSQAAEAYRIGKGHIERYKHSLDSTLQLEGFQQQSIAKLPEGVESEATTIPTE
jgi:DNA recombination protein RmuC